MGFYKTTLFYENNKHLHRLCENGSKLCNSKFPCDKCFKYSVKAERLELDPKTGKVIFI